LEDSSITLITEPIGERLGWEFSILISDEPNKVQAIQFHPLTGQIGADWQIGASHIL
jgi:hypothetical protein